jgi:tripartite-type tricarboxylate transporter receptor subunit TctC
MDKCHSTQRRSLLAACAVVLTTPWSAGAQADGVRKLLVGFPPGGAIDTTARVFADKSATLGSLVIENRAGASGNIAAGALAQARPDGDTMMFAPVNVYCISQALYRKLPFDTTRDFSPVGVVASFPWVLAVHPSVPAQTLPQLIEWMKTHPESTNCGMAATGSEGHLMAYAFGKAAGVPLTFVAYRGGAPMAQDLMGGQIPMAFDTIVNLVQPHKAGKVRALAISGTTRAALLPDVPTFTELGFPAATGETWIGVAVPHGTSPAHIETISNALTVAAKSPDVRDKLATLGLTAIPGTPKEMAAIIASDTQRYAALVKAVGLQLD